MIKNITSILVIAVVTLVLGVNYGYSTNVEANQSVYPENPLYSALEDC